MFYFKTSQSLLNKKIILLYIRFDNTASIPCNFTILHTYATDIIYIRDILHGNGNITLVHVIREQNMCGDFMAKKRLHARCSAH